MRTILRIKFGSHLYGTSTPASDLDFKSVFVPDARSILLQRAKGTIAHKRPKAEGEKNVAGDIDEEQFSLQRYLGLLAEGQTVAIDVLFAPTWAMVTPAAPEWDEVMLNRHRLVTKKSAAFVGYCRSQAAKYGIRGSRVAAARGALALLDAGIENYGSGEKLRAMFDEISAMVMATDHMHFTMIPASAGNTEHWEICGRKLPMTASIKNARDIMAKLVSEYGHRALMAERQEGVDWKALSHSVRVATQAIELLDTGHVTFPLPNAAHVLKIKNGERLYQDVATEIEELLVRVEASALSSSLPDTPDLAWIDDFVAAVHKKEIGIA